MANKNKRDGTRAENLVKKAADEAGLVSERAWGSDGRALGETPGVDITASGARIQVKKTKVLPKKWIPPEGADFMVYVNPTPGPKPTIMYAILDVRSLFDLMKRAGGW